MSNRQWATDPLERISHWITLAAFGIAGLTFIVAPVLALYWVHEPFPGFLVERTLLVSVIQGNNWSGNIRGIQYPQRVIRIGGKAVSTSEEYYSVLDSQAVGDEVFVFTEFPDGSVRAYPSIALMEFSVKDLLGWFWLPYLVGMAYLANGVWIFSIRGQTRPGRALAFFSICVALVCGLFFDLVSTHMGWIIWSLALALLGGALASLALRFPVEWAPVKHWNWLLAIPYVISLVLGAWEILSIRNINNPWAHIDSQDACLLYGLLAILFFIAQTIVRARRSTSKVVRRQARLVVLGAALGFTPIILWSVSTISALPLHFNPLIFLALLLIFPLSVDLAILRYRLLEIDQLVNRTLVYGVLTAILAGMYTASVGLSQRLFVALTGEKSDAAIVITTLIVASAFTPLKNRVQGFVEKRFKETPTDVRALHAFEQQVRSFVEMNDPVQMARRLLIETARGLQSESGTVTLFQDGRMSTASTWGAWRGEAEFSIPIECEGKRYGLLLLGPRINHMAYSKQEVDLLLPLVTQVGCAMRLVERQSQFTYP